MEGDGWYYGIFRDCRGLKSVKLSKNLTSISEGTFYNCSGLKEIDLPDKITSIEKYAFEGCGNLRNIIMKERVASIDESAFYAEDLKNITVYGNKGSYAEEWAKEKGAKFDLIENYGKTASGNDVTAPTVKAIEVTSPNTGTYGSGQKVTIDVKFSETITATTMPTLKIKFGTGTERSITTGTLTGSKITYTYTIASGDKGQLITSSLVGGDVQDAAGNKANLTCPIISGNAITANAGVANPGGSNSGNSNNNVSQNGVNTNGTNNSNKGNTSNNNTNANKVVLSSNTNSSSANKNTNSGTDKTVAKTVLPKTGEGITIGILIITIVGVGIFAYVKIRKYKEI